MRFTDVWRLTNPCGFFVLSEYLIILNVNYFHPLPIHGMVSPSNMFCHCYFVGTCFRWTSLWTDIYLWVVILHVLLWYIFWHLPDNIVKLGFTGAIIIFLISAQNIDCGYLLEPPRRGGSNEYRQSMFWAEIWKISEFLSENFLVFGGEIFNIF